MEYAPGLQWYVARIRSNAENLVLKGLERKQFEVLNPTYQKESTRKDRKKILTRPIFVGYLFLHVELNAELHLEILKTSGLIELIKSRRGPIPVPQDQIDNVLLLEKHVGDLFESPDYQEGEEAVVVEGPLKGLRGVIDEADHRFLRIHVDAIPGAVKVEVLPKHVKSVERNLYDVVSKS